MLSSEAIPSRRTDDILYNVRHIARFMASQQIDMGGILEQNMSDISESDVHNLGVVVEQHLSSYTNEFYSLGETDIERTEKGRDAIDLSDERNQGEFDLREQDVFRAYRLNAPASRKAMQKGAIGIYITPPPTHHEMDPDVAVGYNYDGRTMFRIDSMSPDGQTKYMHSFSVFDVPIQAWQNFIQHRYGIQIEPTALAIMEFCNEQLPLQSLSVSEALTTFIGGVAKFTDEDVRDKLHVQLHDFLYKQEELRETTHLYAAEKMGLQTALAMSLGRIATPMLIKRLSAVKKHINAKDREYLDSKWTQSGLEVDELVAKILISTHNVNINNRAGLAVQNLRTLLRLKAKVGEEQTSTMVNIEQKIIDFKQNGLNVDFMTQRNEQMIAESGVGCGGNCSVSIVDLYSEEAQTARSAGLKGSLYKSEQLSRTSKCSCIARKKQANVIVNGKDVVCTNCGEFKVNGEWGVLEREQGDARKTIIASLLESITDREPAEKHEPEPALAA